MGCLTLPARYFGRRLSDERKVWADQLKRWPARNWGLGGRYAQEKLSAPDIADRNCACYHSCPRSSADQTTPHDNAYPSDAILARIHRLVI